MRIKIKKLTTAFLILTFITPALVFATPGEIAHRHLEFIYENFPNRISFSYMELETAMWIVDELLNMGHSLENIRIQEFPMGEHLFMMNVLLDASEDEEVFAEITWLSVFNFNITDFSDFDQIRFRNYSQNVILTVPGQSKETIVVGTHYDGVFNHGISDNASGMVMLLESANNILSLDNYYTIQYVFFGAEEVGLVGAYYFVDSLTEEEAENIVLMINIDVIFDGSRLTFGSGYHDSLTFEEVRTSATLLIDELAERLNEERGLELIREDYGIYLPSDQLAFVFSDISAPIVVFYSVDGFVPMPLGGGGFRQDLELALLAEAMLDGTEDEIILAEIEANIDSINNFLESMFFQTRENLEMYLEWIREIQTEDVQNITNLYEYDILTTDWDNTIAFLEKQLELLDHPNIQYFWDELGLESVEPVEPVENIWTVQLFRDMYNLLNDVSLDMINMFEQALTRDPAEETVLSLMHITPFMITDIINWLTEAMEEELEVFGELSEQVELLEAMLAVITHPNWEQLAYDLGITIIEWGYAAEVRSRGMGYVLHTPNDSLTFINETWPGLIERALYSYSIFLEEILTLPGGSLTNIY